MPLPAGKQGLFHGLLSFCHPSICVSPNPFLSLTGNSLAFLLSLSLSLLSVYSGEKHFAAVVVILSIPCVRKLMSTSVPSTHVQNTRVIKPNL